MKEALDAVINVAVRVGERKHAFILECESFESSDKSIDEAEQRYVRATAELRNALDDFMRLYGIKETP